MPRVLRLKMVMSCPKVVKFLRFLTIYDFAIYDEVAVPINRKKRGTTVFYIYDTHNLYSLIFESNLTIILTLLTGVGD